MNTHHITALNKAKKQREPLSMQSAAWACLNSLDLYKKQFKKTHSHFKVTKLT